MQEVPLVSPAIGGKVVSGDGWRESRGVVPTTSNEGLTLWVDFPETNGVADGLWTTFGLFDALLDILWDGEGYGDTLTGALCVGVNSAVAAALDVAVTSGSDDELAVGVGVEVGSTDFVVSVALGVLRVFEVLIGDGDAPNVDVEPDNAVALEDAVVLADALGMLEGEATLGDAIALVSGIMSEVADGVRVGSPSVASQEFPSSTAKYRP